jgi:hypothetical protein
MDRRGKKAVSGELGRGERSASDVAFQESPDVDPRLICMG